jgi:hypothetical protein
MKKTRVHTKVATKETQNKAEGLTLPGFVNDDDVGLGDVIKRVTNAFGIRNCGGCERRAATLNRWLTFSGRRSK